MCSTVSTLATICPHQLSLSNYIASFTNGVNSDNLLFEKDKYNPYLDGSEDWLSILAYNSMLISSTTDNTEYTGLFRRTERRATLSIT